jgi:predicted ATPase/DNA-binding winged helix-turn-helix (wHTH) protein/tetratricopeptide (TPR) repeat protein
MSTVYELGPFHLDPEAGVLSRAGVPMALGARAVAVLITLVKRPNEFVQKRAIIDAAWPGVVVEESNLAVQIFSIRRALAHTPGGEHWIETLPRRGYRFVGPLAARGNSPLVARAMSTNSNLPEPRTSFVGRERELVEIKRLLPKKRLLTLVGMGGIGKTRLALQAAAEVMAAYRDGIWLVELGSISDVSLVLTTVAQVLGVRERTGKQLMATLCTHLKTRQLLLILDNCEHLLDACATLVDAVLRGAPDVTIIATSRESLHVEGEQTYPLQPLSLPEPTAGEYGIERSEAVQPFVERAQRQLPDFELTAVRVAAVAELCIHLDGIPLALEFAATRVRSLSVEQINARIGDRFRLLTSGSHATQPRQHTLRATLDWSYDLLADDERTVLRRVSIFPGSFTLEAASSVASDDAIDEFAVTDLVSQLVDRSLVVADTSSGGARYRLLETTRAYALEKLTDPVESRAVRRRHAVYLRDLFDGGVEGSRGSSDSRWRDLYFPERDNVRAALDWAFGDEGDPELAVTLTGATRGIWTGLSLQSEGRARIESAIAAMTTDTPASEQARLWLSLAVVWGTAEPARAAEASERAIALYRQLGDTVSVGHSLQWLARMRVFMGKFDQAAPLFVDALALLENGGTPKSIGDCLEGDGFRKMLTGDLAGARNNFERALAQFRAAGATSAILGVLVNLGDLSWALGDLDAALAQCHEGIRLMRSAPHFAKDMLGICLTNLSGVLAERGELAEALAAAREGLPLRRATGHAWLPMDHFALRVGLAGRIEHAARIAGYADAIYAAKQSLRHLNEARARTRLMVLLRERLGDDELARLMTAGAALDEDEVCRLALEQ